MLLMRRDAEVQHPVCGAVSKAVVQSDKDNIRTRRPLFSSEVE